MDALVEGYHRFRAEIWPAERARYEALANWGQRPATMIISCSDSRVDPQTVFGAVPGEMFVVRNIGGIVPPYQPESGGYHGTSAAIEFGVRVLKVSRLVVLGHAQCGGVRAMMLGPPPEARDFVASWVEIAKPALEATSGDPAKQVEEVEAAVVRLSLANLMMFPWVAQAVEEGWLKLLGFRFDIHNGVLSRVEADGLQPVA
jgi:carbonic anhydrase